MLSLTVTFSQSQKGLEILKNFRIIAACRGKSNDKRVKQIGQNIDQNIPQALLKGDFGKGIWREFLEGKF